MKASITVEAKGAVRTIVLQSLGGIFGLQLAGSMTGMALGGYLGGALHDLTGSYASAFLASLGAGLASIALAACRAGPRSCSD